MRVCPPGRDGPGRDTIKGSAEVSVRRGPDPTMLGPQALSRSMQMPGRDNGFVARHYVPLADLDPRLAEAMLEVLKVEGIAAYVVPSTGRLGGYLEVHLPERPRDQLWVDREHHDRATALLDAHRADPERAAEPSSAELPPDALAG